MKTKIRLFIIGAVLVNVSACTYIKNLFPDKEKDYQFTTEIPPLVLPPDLSGGSLANVPAAPPVTPEKADTAPAPSIEEAPAVERKSIQVELVDADQGTKQLHIGVPANTAWRMVGKALSRKSVEVTNRNQEEKLFEVQYDPNKDEVEDESILDEAKFFLKGLDTTEQEFVLKLVENNNRQTDVIITDKEQKPVSNASSLSLLMLLHDTIKADLAK